MLALLRYDVLLRVQFSRDFLSVTCYKTVRFPRRVGGIRLANPASIHRCCVACSPGCVQVVNEKLADKSFDTAFVAQWTAQISEACLHGCRKLEKPFKFIGALAHLLVRCRLRPYLCHHLRHH